MLASRVGRVPTLPLLSCGIIIEAQRAARDCGDRPRTRRHPRADGTAPLLRLRLCRPATNTFDGLGDKTVIFGVISMGEPAPETPETVAARTRAALAHLPPERLIPAPDCGMKYIPRDLAFAKLKGASRGCRDRAARAARRVAKLYQLLRATLSPRPVHDAQGPLQENQPQGRSCLGAYRDPAARVTDASRSSHSLGESRQCRASPPAAAGIRGGITPPAARAAFGREAPVNQAFRRSR
jgi:Cobalamin-independent synthase, Catalytic domain